MIAQQAYEVASAASKKSMGVINQQFMIGWLCKWVADLQNELDGYSIPDVEPGHIHTAFVHQGVHLVAEWERESGDVCFLWDGSSDVLQLFEDVPDWVHDAIDRDNAEISEAVLMDRRAA